MICMHTVQTQLETTCANATRAILEVDFSVKVSLDVMCKIDVD